MKSTILRMLVFALLLVWLALSRWTQDNWREAYEGKPLVSTVFLDHGRLRYNPDSPIHIIAGYDIENCVVEALPQNNVLYLLNIKVDAPNSPSAISISAPGMSIVGQREE